MESAKPEDILKDPGRLRWYRFNILLYYCGIRILKDIFHGRRKIQAPWNGQELCNYLKDYEYQFSKIMNEKELNKLFPQNGITNEENFDISLYGKVIVVILDYFHEVELSQQALCEIKKDIAFTKWLRERRNELAHKANYYLSSPKFEERWHEAFSFFQDYGFNIASFKDLKNLNIFSIDKYKDIALHLLSQGRLDLFACVKISSVFKSSWPDALQKKAA